MNTESGALAAEPDTTREYFRIRRGQSERKKSLTEEMGQTRSDFVDSTGLNKTAVGFAERMDKLSAEVRADVFRSLDLIREQMGPVWSQEETRDMFDAKTPDEKFEAGAEAGKRARTTARRNKAPKDPTPGPHIHGHPDDGPYDPDGNSLKGKPFGPEQLNQAIYGDDAQPIDWRDPIPGVDDDAPAETGDDAPVDVDRDFLAPDAA